MQGREVIAPRSLVCATLKVGVAFTIACRPIFQSDVAAFAVQNPILPAVMCGVWSPPPFLWPTGGITFLTSPSISACVRACLAEAFSDQLAVDFLVSLLVCYIQYTAGLMFYLCYSFVFLFIY